MLDNKIMIIEGICYLYPHKKELVATDLSMIGTWRTVLGLLNKNRNAFLAPLLVDDLKREDFIVYQTVENIVEKGINKKVKDLPWFGEQILESTIERQYGNLGCKLFDSIYHKDVLFSLFSLNLDWKWVMVHPEIFKEQQSGMLLDLWGIVSKSINFNSIGNKRQKKGDDVRNEIRDDFLSRFEHYWIDESGTIKEITKPIYLQKKIVHKKHE